VVVTAALACLGCVPDRTDRHLPMEDGERVVRVLYAGADENIFSPGWDDTPKFLIFQPLVTYAANSCSEIIGGLAESWEASPDWRTWTVTLRSGVTWHDGVPVTAEDVAFTVGLWKHPDVLNYGAGPVDSIEVLDSLRFRVHQNRPGDWPVNGWEGVYPKHPLAHLDPADFYEWEFWTQPVGNGPFRYVRHVPETMVELEANPDFYLGRPAIDRVRIQFKAGGQGQTGVVELLAGNADVVSLSPLEASLIEHDERFVTYYRYQAGTQWLIWNYTDPLFDDVRVRQALAHATDRRSLQRILGFPADVPVTDGIFFMCDPLNMQVVEPHQHDPARARMLLAEAGWADDDGDGVLDRDGRPFAFTLVLHPDASTAAVFVQDQLRRIGIDMGLQTLDGNVGRARFESGDFQAIIVQVLTPERRAVALDSPLGVVLDTVLALEMDAAQREPDIERKLELFEEVGRRYRRLAPAMFLHATISVIAADRRLQGLGDPGMIVQRMSWRHAFGGLEHLRIAD
jgi:peptide/nickel transport system substrate-binding protein